MDSAILEETADDGPNHSPFATRSSCARDSYYASIERRDILRERQRRICGKRSSRVGEADEWRCRIHQAQLEQANRLFHDAEGRRLDPEVVVLTIVAPIVARKNQDTDEEYMLLHRCYWDIHTPHAMVDVYCGDIVNDMGFDSSTAQLLSMCMKSEIDAIRQQSVTAPKDTRGDTRDILVDTKTKMVFPMVIKGGRDVAERLKESLKDVPFGEEECLMDVQA
eukprot:jgi/Picre1/33970/NNA_001447.t1